jgi:hypothetical protein
MSESEIETPSVNGTTEKCPGCGKDLDVLVTHLKIAAKTERGVIVEQPLSEWEAVVSGQERSVEKLRAAMELEEEEETVQYLGWRSGAGEQVRVHNGDCASKYFAKNYKDDKPKIKFFKAAEDDYETVGRGND